MKSYYLFIVLPGILLLSCNEPTPQADPIADMFPQEQEEIKKIIYDIFEVAKAKDMDSLDSYHLNSPKFTKYDDSGMPDRQDYAMAKKMEEELFVNLDEFNYTPPDIKVDVFEHVAISTFILDYGGRMGEVTFTGKSRSTIVFVKDNGRWKIAHEHFSPFIEASE
jgi:ketosteroid isomerase-like protein